jgi:hypothetical protein
MEKASHPRSGRRKGPDVTTDQTIALCCISAIAGVLAGIVFGTAVTRKLMWSGMLIDSRPWMEDELPDIENRCRDLNEFLQRRAHGQHMWAELEREV